MGFLFFRSMDGSGWCRLLFLRGADDSAMKPRVRSAMAEGVCTAWTSNSLPPDVLGECDAPLWLALFISCTALCCLILVLLLLFLPRLEMFPERLLYGAARTANS